LVEIGNETAGIRRQAQHVQVAGQQAAVLQSLKTKRSAEAIARPGRRPLVCS
jgi:hypothetical protein